MLPCESSRPESSCSTSSSRRFSPMEQRSTTMKQSHGEGQCRAHENSRQSEHRGVSREERTERGEQVAQLGGANEAVLLLVEHAEALHELVHRSLLAVLLRRLVDRTKVAKSIRCSKEIKASKLRKQIDSFDF